MGEDLESCILEEPEDESHNVSVVTFWTEDPEDNALKVLADRVDAGGGSMAAITKDNRTDLQKGLFAPGQDPPDVYQVNGGSDVLQFALDAPSSSTRICSLDKLFSMYKLEDKYFRGAWEPSMCEGSHYAIPLNIHRVNTLLVNTKLYELAKRQARQEGFELLDIREMTSAEQLVEALEWVFESELENENGERIVPLSVGIWNANPDEETVPEEGADPPEPVNTWPLTILAYESLLASYPDSAYEVIWEGKKDEADVREALDLLTEHLERLGAVSNIWEPLTWQAATNKVIQGEALLTINGDWVGAQVSSNEADDVEIMVFPNDQGNFVYTPDSFAVPRLPQSDGKDAHGWFSDVTHHELTQLRFAAKKKAIPALRGLSKETLARLGSDYLVDTYLEFSKCEEGPDRKDCRLLLAVSGLAPGSGFDPCFDRTGMVLSVIAGMEYEDSAWFDEADEKRCDRPIPRTRDEAKEELLEILLAVAEEPFAQKCRQAP